MMNNSYDRYVLIIKVFTVLVFRGIRSAREGRVETPLTQQDRSKSVPHEEISSTKHKSTVSFLESGIGKYYLVNNFVVYGTRRLRKR